MADISDPSWNETDGNNTNGPPLGWPPNMPANQVEPTSRAMMGAIKRFWDRTNATITTTGAAGTYVWTPGNAAFPVVLSQGESYAFRAHQASIGGDTFNPNNLGPKPLYKPGGSAPSVIGAGDINLGGMYVAYYDGTLGGTGAFQVIAGQVPTAVRGRVNGGVPATGLVGEYLSSILFNGGALNPIASGANQDIISLLLTPGDYDIWSEVWVSCDISANIISRSETWTNTLSATPPLDVSNSTSRNTLYPVPGTNAYRQFVGMAQASFAVPTTYYLTVRLNYTGPSNLILTWGKLCARRRS